MSLIDSDDEETLEFTEDVTAHYMASKTPAVIPVKDPSTWDRIRDSKCISCATCRWGCGACCVLYEFFMFCLCSSSEDDEDEDHRKLTPRAIQTELEQVLKPYESSPQ